jgi:NAD(P)-dependent dehydrogenase (short-subunit alcohol dehydrogenase family)
VEIKEGQVAVVTGAASGIGFALSDALAARGARLVMADINEELLRDSAARINRKSAAVAVCGDVSRAEDVAALRAKALEAFGRVDLVVNNAGVVLPFVPMWEHSLDDWQWLMGINLWGVIHGIRTFVPDLIAQGSGHIVNTASMAGVSVIPFNGVYNASKHAVVSLTETLAGELAQRAPGVHATVVCPGLVPTRIAPRGVTRAAVESQRPVARAENYAITAEEAAARIVAGVEQNLTYVFTNPGSSALIEARFAEIRHAFQPWN